MAMGLFSLDGGSAYNPMYDITSPVFNEITIRLILGIIKGTSLRLKYMITPLRIVISRKLL